MPTSMIAINYNMSLHIVNVVSMLYVVSRYKVQVIDTFHKCKHS